MSIHPAIAEPEALSADIPTDDQQVGPLATAICVDAREALAPSSYRRLLWAVQTGLERRFAEAIESGDDRRFGEAIQDAQRFAAESVELVCLRAEIARHIDAPCCSSPDLSCEVVQGMLDRRDSLDARLSRGMP